MGFSVAFIIEPLLGMYIAEEFSFSVLWWTMTLLGVVALGGFVYTKKKIQEEQNVLEPESVLSEV